MCTDYSVYQSIFYHLISNAIKFSPPDSVVSVSVAFQPVKTEGELNNSLLANQPSHYGNLTGFLVTKITDRGKGIEPARLRNRKFKTFAFSKAGSNQVKSETEGVGVGLSTADSLTTALGGTFSVKSNQSLSKSGVEVNFSILTTSLNFIGVYSEDLESLKNNSNPQKDSRESDHDGS